MITSHIAPLGGVPTLFVNGSPVPQMAYITYFTDKNRYADFAADGMRLFSVPLFFAAQPINENGQTPVFYEGIFENGDNFAAADREINRLLDAVPDAMIFPRVNVNLPRHWELDHPDELCDSAFHEPRRRVCFSSDIWADETERLLRRFIAHMSAQPYADHIIGYQIAAGNTEEWFPLDGQGSVGKRSREGFARAVLRGEYVDTEAEYYYYLSRTIVQRIDRFASLVKELTDHRLVVGAFYGYSFECAPRTYAHNAMEDLLRSPNVDFICSPVSYMDTRPLGQDHPNMTAIDSIKHHGKLYFAENDTRTDHAAAPWDLPNYTKPIWYGPCREDSLEIIRMHFARALTHGHAMWWFDMWGGWYDGEDFHAQFKKMQQIAADSLSLPRAGTAQTAVFIDERANDGGAPNHFIYTVRRALGAVGASYDAWLIGDFTAVAARYKLCIFLVPEMTDALRKAIDSCPCASLIITAENSGISPAELRQVYTDAGVRLRGSLGSVVYESESYLYIYGDAESQPEGWKPILYGKGTLYQKI